jgi:hypothetical protein
MFEFLLRVKALHRLGLATLLRTLFVALLIGAVIAGLINTFVVFHAVTHRSSAPNVHASSPQ